MLGRHKREKFYGCLITWRDFGNISSDPLNLNIPKMAFITAQNEFRQ